MRPDPWLLALLPLAGYAVFAVLAILGLRRQKSTPRTGEPPVSVIVVGRDEEKSLPGCLASLERLDYPSDKLDVVLVNDRSTDATGSMMEAFALERPNVHTVHVTRRIEGFTGKTYGLIRGVDQSRGEWLFFTDADCEVPTGWIRTTLRGLDPETRIASGFLVLDRGGGKWFDRIQTLDWISITAMGCAWANWGRPISAFGNNLAVRRDNYVEAGGFTAVGHHLTEDFALVRNVVRLDGYSVQFVMDPGNTVYSRPARTPADFFHQRKRWILGSRHYGPVALAIMATVFLTHVSIVAGLAAGRFTAAAVVFLAICVLDVAVMVKPLRLLGRLDLVRVFLPYRLYLFVYSMVMAPFFFFGRRIQWKSETYRA